MIEIACDGKDVVHQKIHILKHAVVDALKDVLAARSILYQPGLIDVAVSKPLGAVKRRVQGKGLGDRPEQIVYFHSSSGYFPASFKS